MAGVYLYFFLDMGAACGRYAAGMDWSELNARHDLPEMFGDYFNGLLAAGGEDDDGDGDEDEEDWDEKEDEDALWGFEDEHPEWRREETTDPRPDRIPEEPAEEDSSDDYQSALSGEDAAPTP